MEYSMGFAIILLYGSFSQYYNYYPIKFQVFFVIKYAHI